MSYYPHAHHSAASGDRPVSLGVAVVVIGLLSLGLWATLWLVVADLF